MTESPIQFVKNDKAKRYIIRILSNGMVRVTIPRYGSMSKAQSFLNEQMQLVQQKVEKNQCNPFEINTFYKTHFHRILITQSTHKNNSCKITEGKVLIRISELYDPYSNDMQEFIGSILEKVLKQEAKLYIPKKTMHFALENRLKVSDIKINSAKTRWGSCSARNSLNFSFYLMQLPLELVDYVILHELSHTIHKNHSSQFYNLLNNFCGGKHMELNHQLKKYAPHIKADYFEKV